MLTPKFSVSQDASHVTVEVWLTGLCRLDQAEATVEDDTLLLSCEPYFLRLRLTGHCVDSDAEDAGSLQCRFDADTGLLTLSVRKAEVGQHFPDLGMLTSLLSGGGQQQQRMAALVQELMTGEEPPSCQTVVALDDAFDWFLEPDTPHSTASAAAGSSCTLGDDVIGGGLGFAFRRRDKQSAGILQGMDHLLPGLASLSHAERLSAKEAQEDEQFDPDYYLADLFEPSDLLTATLKVPELPLGPMEPEERRARLMTLPRRPQLPLDDWELRACLLALAELVFAFCLDWRVCEGEQTSESARSVLTQAACLSCQCPLGSVPQLLRSCYRRALCYGLLRSWRLCQRVAMDTVRVLDDKELTLDCLLRLERLFARGADGSLAAINYLAVTDLCVWLQRCPAARLTELAASLRAGVEQFGKEDVGLQLSEWELAGGMQAAEIG